MSLHAIVGCILNLTADLRLCQRKELLPGNAGQLTALCVKRIAVEELFRDS